MTQHIHMFQGTSANARTLPPNATGNLLATAANLYTSAQNLTSLNPSTIGNQGGSQPHQNMQPFLTLSFCIALQGIFPSQT